MPELTLIQEMARWAEPVTAWMLTYALHSTLLLAAAWCLGRALGERRLALQETAWKVALVGGLLTASLQVGLAVEPLAGTVALAQGGAAGVATSTSEPTATVGLTRDDGATLPAPQSIRDAAPMAATATAAQPAAMMARTADGAAADAAPAGARPLWPLAAAGVWLSVALLGLAALGLAYIRLYRCLADRRGVTDGALPALFGRLLQRAGLRPASAARRRSGVRLTASARLPVPIAWGVARREVSLPEEVVEDLSPYHQESILAHEISHLRRHDPAWLALSRGLETALFFQPLNRVARHRLQEIAEYRCDDAAVALTGRPVELARCLTEVATWRLSSASRALVPGLLLPGHLVPGMTTPEDSPGRRGSALAARVRRILDDSRSQAETLPKAVLPAAGALLLAVALVAPGVTGQERAPQPPTAPEAPAAEPAPAVPATPEAAPTPSAVPGAAPEAAPAPAAPPSPSQPTATAPPLPEAQPSPGALPKPATAPAPAAVPSLETAPSLETVPSLETLPAPSRLPAPGAAPLPSPPSPPKALAPVPRATGGTAPRLFPLPSAPAASAPMVSPTPLPRLARLDRAEAPRPDGDRRRQRSVGRAPASDGEREIDRMVLAEGEERARVAQRLEVERDALRSAAEAVVERLDAEAGSAPREEPIDRRLDELNTSFDRVIGLLDGDAAPRRADLRDALVRAFEARDRLQAELERAHEGLARQRSAEHHQRSREERQRVEEEARRAMERAGREAERRALAAEEAMRAAELAMADKSERIERETERQAAEMAQRAEEVEQARAEMQRRMTREHREVERRLEAAAEAQARARAHESLGRERARLEALTEAEVRQIEMESRRVAEESAHIAATSAELRRLNAEMERERQVLRRELRRVAGEVEGMSDETRQRVSRELRRQLADLDEEMGELDEEVGELNEELGELHEERQEAREELDEEP